MDEDTLCQSKCTNKKVTKRGKGTTRKSAGKARAGVCVLGPGGAPRNDRPAGALRWGWSLSQNERIVKRIAKRIAKRIIQMIQIIQMGRVGRLEATDGGGICFGFGWGRGGVFLGFLLVVHVLDEFEDSEGYVLD